MEYFIQVEPGVNIYVQDINPSGNQTILFIHGWPLSHKAYEYQFNRLPDLGFRCIGMDTRGFGNSNKPWHGYDYDRLSDDVRFVVQALDLHNFTLAGHSMGGAIALRYMARHQEFEVSKLALFGAAAPSLTSRLDFPYGIPKEEVTKLIDATYNDRPKMLWTLKDKFFHQQLSEPFYHWFFQLGLQAASWATIECATTFRDETLFSDLSKISVPTLILHGIYDEICLFSLAEIMKSEIKDSTLIPFDHSGHGLFYEERDKFNKELIQFLK